MQVAESAIECATMGRISFDYDSFQESIAAHTGSVVKTHNSESGVTGRTRHFEYGIEDIVKGLQLRCNMLRSMSRRLICTKENSVKVRTFHSEIWFDTKMIEDYIARLDLTGLTVYQHDSSYICPPRTYKGGRYRVEQTDALYFIEEPETKTPMIKPQSTKRVRHNRPDPVATAQDLLPLPPPLPGFPGYKPTATPIAVKSKEFL